MDTTEHILLILLVVAWSCLCAGIGAAMGTDNTYLKVIQGSPIVIEDKFHEKTYSCSEVVNNG